MALYCVVSYIPFNSSTLSIQQSYIYSVRYMHYWVVMYTYMYTHTHAHTHTHTHTHIHTHTHTHTQTCSCLFLQSQWLGKGPQELTHKQQLWNQRLREGEVQPRQGWEIRDPSVLTGLWRVIVCGRRDGGDRGREWRDTHQLLGGEVAVWPHDNILFTCRSCVGAIMIFYLQSNGEESHVN